MSWVRGRRLWVVALAALAALVVPSAAGATHSWNGYHWARTTNSFTLKLGSNLSGTWGQYLATTSTDWSLSTVLDTAIVPGAATLKSCKATSGRVQVCNAAYGNTGWLGVAQVWVSGSHITQGTVKVNDTYFNTATYNRPEWKNLVMCQEVGHTLGLDHQDTIFDNANLGTCMDYTSNPLGPPDNQHPNQHDYDELVIIYTHRDNSSTLSSSVSPSARGSFDTPGEWGHLVRGSTAPRSAAVYQRSLGGDQTLLTFVIRA